MTIGIGLLWLHLPIIAIALLIYGAGIGIDSIARGTLPLAGFGVEEYPSIVGRIAMPSRFVQAAAPFVVVGAILIDQIGATGALAILFASSMSALTVAVVLARLLCSTGAPAPAPRQHAKCSDGVGPQCDGNRFSRTGNDTDRVPG